MHMSAQSNAVKVAAVGAATLLVATPAFAGDADAGEKIFTANCAACHAGGQNSIIPDHTLEKTAIEKVVLLALIALGFECRCIARATHTHARDLHCGTCESSFRYVFPFNVRSLVSFPTFYSVPAHDRLVLPLWCATKKTTSKTYVGGHNIKPCEVVTAGSSRSCPSHAIF